MKENYNLTVEEVARIAGLTVADIEADIKEYQDSIA